MAQRHSPANGRFVSSGGGSGGKSVGAPKAQGRATSAPVATNRTSSTVALSHAKKVMAGHFPGATLAQKQKAAATVQAAGRAANAKHGSNSHLSVSAPKSKKGW